MLISRPQADSPEGESATGVEQTAGNDSTRSNGGPARVAGPAVWWTGQQMEAHRQSLMRQLRDQSRVGHASLVQFFVSRESAPATGAEESSMNMSRFDQLLEQLPRIAKVINAFESVEIQREVFNALMQAYLVDAESCEATAAVAEMEEPLSQDVPDAGSAIDDDADDQAASGLQIDLGAEEIVHQSEGRETGLSGGDSIHSFIQH